MRALRRYDPHLVGTLPLGLGVAGSDIDIVCQADDTAAFALDALALFGEADGFAMWQWLRAKRSVVVSFVAEQWPFEIFASPQPVRDQPAWRHFDVEQRLLAIGGARLRNAVMAARREGLKTEAAFASVLKLVGDPFAVICDLQAEPDAVLQQRLEDLFFDR